MKILLSTAKVLNAELNEKISAASASDTEIELSDVAVALLYDAKARNEVNQAIDESIK